MHQFNKFIISVTVIDGKQSVKTSDVPVDPRETWADFKGWRFTYPYRCMMCGIWVSLDQFCFGRTCGACDCGHKRRTSKGVFSGPRKLIDVNAENFINEDQFANPLSGLNGEHLGLTDEQLAKDDKMRQEDDREIKEALRRKP